MTEYICPADISNDLADKIKNDALKVYYALGLSVYARIDYRLNSQNQFFCLEANTLPGMTSTSLVPKSLKSAGFEFIDLIRMIIDESLKRYQQ
jgi:D-alanine-D-alanine ligase